MPISLSNWRKPLVERLASRIKVISRLDISEKRVPQTGHLVMSTLHTTDAPTTLTRLLNMGVRVRAFDPIAMSVCREQNPALRISYCADAQSAVEHADALVLVTEWPQFADLDLADLAKRMNKAVLVDGRNLFDPARARAAGFDYCGIGRATSARAPEVNRGEAIQGGDLTA